MGKNLQDKADQMMTVLMDASASAGKMTSHKEADQKVEGFKVRWEVVYVVYKEWVARMTTLVECWNKLDGNVGELSSWVSAKDSAAPDGSSEISIEKLETQLNTLKTMFAEKQKLVSDLDDLGPSQGEGAPATTESAPPAAPEAAPAAEEAAPADAPAS